MSGTLRTPDDWCEHYGLVIADPDGWRGRDAPPWEQPLGLPEFWRRFNECTARLVDDETTVRIRRDIQEGRADDERPGELNYIGPLNLLPRPPRARRPCSLHPHEVIGEHGWLRCREIHRTRQIGNADA